MREGCVDRFKPSINSRFADVYFLSAADQTNDNSPIYVAIHAGNQKLWLGFGESCYSLFPLHEIGSLSHIPCTLGLVKNYHMFDWRA